MSDDTKPARQMIARAIDARGGGYLAEFAYPGVYLHLVHGPDDKPVVYATAADAEFHALRMLRDTYNSRTRRTSSRRDESVKWTADEFAYELGLADIAPDDWATMWGTKQGRVMEQLQGLLDVPFPVRWILPVLRAFPEALAMAQKIVAENTSVKPGWLERKRRSAENRAEDPR